MADKRVGGAYQPDADYDCTGGVRRNVTLNGTTAIGSGATITSPTLTTPVLGAATATSLAASSFVSTGAAPATTGEIRLSNSTGIIDARNAANSANLRLLRLTASDVCEVGDNSGFLVLRGGTVLSAGPFGYAAGSGGTVAQATSKSTGVTLSKNTGEITMDAASLAAGTIVSFTLTNTQIAATDALILNHLSGGTVGSYGLNAQCGAGSAVINVRNNTAGALAEALVLRFVLVKGVSA